MIHLRTWREARDCSIRLYSIHCKKSPAILKKLEVHRAFAGCFFKGNFKLQVF